MRKTIKLNITAFIITWALLIPVVSFLFLIPPVISDPIFASFLITLFFTCMTLLIESVRQYNQIEERNENEQTK